MHKTCEGHTNGVAACKLYTNAVGDPTALRSCIYNNPACCLLSKPRLRHNVTNGNQIYDAIRFTSSQIILTVKLLSLAEVLVHS